jgi:hypothetical protein
MTDKLEGYLHPGYASSFAEFGEIRSLERSGAWYLVRSIAGSEQKDAMAGYRNLFCLDWEMLAEDIDRATDIVSVVAVTDPMTSVDISYLKRCFPDLVRPYKHNYVVDLRAPSPSAQHRAKARRALAQLDVTVEARPLGFLDEWVSLYDQLCRRHRLDGVRAFSRRAFTEQLAVPGCIAFRALSGGVCVSTCLWYTMGDVAHYHLGASSTEGYALSASYALFDAAIETFKADGKAWLNLGSGAGAEHQKKDGLSRFKRGWATGSRESYLCGRIYDHEGYRALTRARTSTPGDYFPAYRYGEYD